MKPWLNPHRTAAPLLVAALFGLLADGFFRSPSSPDYSLLRAMDHLNTQPLPWLFELGVRMTPVVLSAASAFAFAALCLRRSWLTASVLLVVPFAGLLAWVLSIVWLGSAPDSARLDSNRAPDASGDPIAFFVQAAMGIVFFGLIAATVVPGIPGRVIPVLVRVAAIALGIATVFAGPWNGDLWVTEALAAGVVGGLILLGAVRAYRAMAPTTLNVPLVHAVYVDAPGERSVHALTSTILFRDQNVWKIYSPGFIPRLAYWLSFQAPFAYSTKRISLEAAVYRRNLAGKLTEFWYGTNRVAPALGIEDYQGRMALVSPFVPGSEPRDHAKARDFLFDICNRFDEAGLPTWQIDPRQPRSLGNAMELADGSYTIIDLESGMVSPLASPRAWWRAVRRAQFPFYDDVVFDVTREYVAKEREAMLARHGEPWMAELESLLNSAEASAKSWHASEPRIWSRLLRWLWSGFGLFLLPGWLRARMTAGEAHATAWIEDAIETWVREDRLTPGEAANLRASVESPDIQAVIPHLGVHLLIGVALRFPVGSIARVTYVSTQLLVGTARFAVRRMDRREWRRHVGIHSPLVILIAALPGVGTFSYLASWPILSKRALIRVALDAVGEHLPKKVYRRSGLRRLIARRPRVNSAPGAASRSPGKPQ